MELADLSEITQIAWQALGQAQWGQTESEKGSMEFRRSLYIVDDIRAGSVLNEANIRSIRPGYGMAPKHLPNIIGHTAARDLKRGEPLDWSMLDDTKDELRK